MSCFTAEIAGKGAISLQPETFGPIRRIDANAQQTVLDIRGERL